MMTAYNAGLIWLAPSPRSLAALRPPHREMMCRCRLVLLIVALAACAAQGQTKLAKVLPCADNAVSGAPASHAPKLVIPNGQRLRVANLRTISSGNALPGDSHDFQLMEDLCIDHVIIIPQHTRFTAKVVEVGQEGHGHGGKLGLVFQSLSLCSGETLSVGGSTRRYRDRHSGRAADDLAGGLVADSLNPISAPIAVPIMIAKFFRTGSPMLIDRGTEQILYVQGDTAVQPDANAEQHCDSGFPAGLLLRATHEESSGFAPGNTTKTIEAFRDGTVKYQCVLEARADSKQTECGRSSLQLSPDDLHALMALLDREPVQALDGEYRNRDFTTDYYGSMSIVILRPSWRQSLHLPGLVSSKRNDGRYPSAVRQLVCRIFGLRQQAGDPYGHPKTMAPGGEWEDDTWCQESDLKGLP